MTMAAPLSTDEVERIRAQLPTLQGPAYLNAGTLGPLPQPAIDAMIAERRYDIEHRQGPEHWERLTQLQRDARDAISALTGAERAQVALMHSTHEGLSACIWGLELRPGDNIVTTDEEHPGLLVPLRHARARLACDVRMAHWGEDDESFVAAVLEQVDERTRAVAISHVSWISGRTAPLRMLREALPAGVRLIVDGAQSAGVLVVDPADGWDAYTVSGQKWPCGPNGSGGVALRDPEAWLPTYGAYMQVTEFDDIIESDLVTDGRRLEMSQEALTPLAGIAASVRWLVTDVGLTRAHDHARALNDRARERLLAAGVAPEALRGDAHLLCIDVPDERAMELSGTMHEAGYLIRPLGTTRLRLSFGCWNLPVEVDGCVDALAERLG